MKEIPVTFRNGKYKLYGMLVLPENKGKSVIVTAPGFRDRTRAHHMWNVSRRLVEKGFAVLKLDFHGWRKSEKRLKGDTVTKEISDLIVAIKFLKSKGYKKIGLVGHSLGGMVSLLLQSQKNIADVIVTWEPSNRLARLLKGKFKRDIKIPKKGQYALANWEIQFLMSKKMLEEWKELGDISQRLKSITCPVMMVAAEKSILIKDVKKFYKTLRGPKSLKVIKGADHDFGSYEHEDKLIRYTVSWFNKWLK